VWVWTHDDYRERLDVLDRACERAGRDPASVTRSVGLYTLVGEDQADLERRFQRMRERTLPGVLDGVSLDEWREGRLVGTRDEVADQLGRWQELGVRSLIVSLSAVPFSIVEDDALDLLAQACSLVVR
jgi:alkanesulfonate monooxygenase SsuD/methylene tetrahydromethanopterin reductase-like flavin-dependent oxidoreductase (luciferase family)